MKKLSVLFIVISALIFSLTSCEKMEDPEPGMVRDDNPPKEMFASDLDYGQFWRVYVEDVDVNEAKYFGNYETGNSVSFDYETGARIERSYSQDYYKISAKKFFGLYLSKIRISKSNDFYLISAGDLAYVTELVGRKGSAVVSLGGRDIDYRWKTISGAEK